MEGIGVGEDDISLSRRENMAKTFGWWIGKNSLELGVLKPIPFAALQDQSKSFLISLMNTIFICSQTTSPTLLVGATTAVKKDTAALERIFEKVDGKLGTGLLHFLEEIYPKGKGTKGKTKEIISWGTEVAIDILNAGRMQDRI